MFGKTNARNLSGASTLCYVAEDIVAGTTVLANAGVGNSEYDYELVNEGSTNSNELSLSALAKSDGTAGGTGLAKITKDDVIVTITIDQDDAEILLNNENDIVSVNVIANDVSKYLCFVQGNKKIYFRNFTNPFIPNVSNKTYTSKTYTYYTYAEGIMTAHSDTTTTNTQDGANTYDGTTLKIDGSDSYSYGTWTRSATNDIEINDSDANIQGVGYLTPITPVITGYKRFTVQFLDQTKFEKPIIVVGGVRYNNTADGQEFLVKKETLCELYYQKKNGTGMKDVYMNTLHITQDKTLIPYTYSLLIMNGDASFADTVTTISLGNTTQAYTTFEITGTSVSIPFYPGDTVRYSVAKTGYTTVEGTYNSDTGTRSNPATVAITLTQE